MEEMKYADAIAELEAIVRKMQAQDCDIDSLSAYTQRAIQLLKICKERLFKTNEDLKKQLLDLNN